MDVSFDIEKCKNTESYTSLNQFYVSEIDVNMIIIIKYDFESP